MPSKMPLQKVFGKADATANNAANTAATPSGGSSDTAASNELSSTKSDSVSQTTLKRRVKDSATARAAAAQISNEVAAPALLALAERFGLSEFERDTLFLCAALEFDPSIANLCGRIHGSPQRNFPSFSLAMSLLDQPGWDAMSSQRPLRYAHLLEILPSPATPLTACALVADERIVNFLKGLNLLDERVRAVTEPVAGNPEPEGMQAQLSPSQEEQVSDILARLRNAASKERVPVIQLIGAEHATREQIAQAICQQLGRNLYRLRLEAIPSAQTEVETLGRLWQRESILLPVALYIEAEELAEAASPLRANLRHFLAQEVGVVVIGVREHALSLSNQSLSVECNKPSTLEQRSCWQSLLSMAHVDEAITLAPMMAGQFDLNLPDIQSICRNLPSSAKGEALQQQTWDACREITRPRLDMLAQRLEAKATWDDLVLPEEQMRIMRNIAAQVKQRHKVYGEWGFERKMNRGFGISALFAGESGTGKTMAAEVIANALRLHLYRIDLSAVVSKYIGETEKNLRKLFDAAEMGGAILFFDEADALFGKRSEVKDSHDRYANIEINYLLQRMEGFSGLAILATNMKSALDVAFMRRLRFVVQFPYPGLKERLAMWQHVLPPQVPCEVLDFNRLARINVSGGNIHSIALNAAFMAAEQGKPVSMAIMLAAARAELKKLDKPVVEAEFRL